MHLYTAETYVERARRIARILAGPRSVQAALLQSQTGFDHHHSNSATALTFIKYLLMFRQVIIHDLDERAAGLFTIQLNVHPPTSVLRNQFHKHA